jgi:hypothetical protein
MARRVVWAHEKLFSSVQCAMGMIEVAVKVTVRLVKT